MIPRIGLFATGIVAAMYLGTAQTTAAIPERLGHGVVFPPEQAR
ncbi:hypothetical protein [Paeniglutamicibacter psychrophenolicus]|uniref:Uncharacterized protein n=1 Tax=Paeniglutamicibacter psychrophenolicus TaxID=257454 RepID=A0ABS4WC21_9MICC|nr:hypothetical protein [Paeniglutamicibacter psychrophenolicus]MBP2373705.1 hypothetical protein [Paeniglutamicibacter psychrophenolicus]